VRILMAGTEKGLRSCSVRVFVSKEESWDVAMDNEGTGVRSVVAQIILSEAKFVISHRTPRKSLTSSTFRI